MSLKIVNRPTHYTVQLYPKAIDITATVISLLSVLLMSDTTNVFNIALLISCYRSFCELSKHSFYYISLIFFCPPQPLSSLFMCYAQRLSQSSYLAFVSYVFWAGGHSSFQFLVDKSIVSVIYSALHSFLLFII